MPPAGVPPDANPRGMILAIVILLLVILGTGILFYQSQEGQVKAGVTSDLTAIQTLKGHQIAAWREDRLYDARVLSSSAFFMEGVDHYLTDGDDESKNTILRRFREMNTSPHYDNVLLVDANGTVRLSLDPSVTSLQPPVSGLVNTSLRSGNVALSDFYRVPGASHTSIDVIAPLNTTRAGVSEPVGAVLLSINPDGFLYPLIQSWPVPSGSAETLLVEREGDHVLYLNELRHQNNTALNLTIPLTRTDLPAVKAVLGTTGPFVGKDYRGVDVISVMGPVPGSPWFMVAKVDTAEAFSSWQSFSALLIVLVAITLGGAVIIIGLLWQRRQKYYYRSLYDAEIARREGEEKFREIVTSLEEGYYSCTPAGVLLEHNIAFNRILGIPPDRDMKGSLLPDFWQDPSDRTDYLAELQKNGFVRAYPIRARKIAGEPITVIASSHFVKSETGEIQRIDGTFTDITALKAAEDALRQKTADLEAAYEEITASDEELRHNYDEMAKSEKKFALAFRSSPYAITITSMSDGTILDANDSFEQISGYALEDIIGKKTPGLGLWENPADRDAVIRDLQNGVRVFGREYRFRTGSGRVITALFSAEVIVIRDTPHILSSINDISDRKQAEEALRESEERFRQFFEKNNAVMILIDPESGEILDANPAAVSFYGHSRDLLRTMNIDDINQLPPDEVALLRRQVTDGILQRFVVPHLLADGRVRTVEIYSSPVHAQQRTYLFSIIHDITERKAAEDELRLKNTVFDTSFAANSIADARGVITHVNPAFLRLWGYRTVGEAVGKSVGSFFAREDDAIIVLKALAEHGAWEGEFPAQKADGSRFISYGIASVIRDTRGSLIGYQSANLDITERKAVQERLRESSEYLRNLIDYANAPIIVWDPQFRITRFNHAFENLTGRSEAEVLGQHIEILFPEPGRDTSLEQIKKTLEGERWETVEIPILHRSGDIRIMLWNSANLVGPDGNMISVIAQGQDITERNAAEEQVKASEMRYRRLFESAKDGILILNKDTGVIIDANPFIESLLGYGPADLIGKHLLDIGLFKDQLLSKVAFKELQAKEYLRYQDLPLETKDGMKIEVEFVSNVYAVDSRTSVIQCNIRDITDRKQAEAALQQSEEKYRVLFSRMVEGSAVHEIVYESDGKPVDYRILDVNPAFESITGIPKQEIVGKTSREAYGVDTPPYLDIYARVVETGHPEGFEVYFAPMQKHFAISVYSPQKGRFATIFEDITDRKKAEETRERLIRELEQKNAELERFTYTVSHDLKSPLITIKGFASLLDDDTLKKDPVQLKKDVRRIISAADTMQELLADVLELSRIGRVIAPLETTSLGTIAREAMDLLAGPLAECGVTVEIAPDLPLVKADHARIREVMVNLIENAVKFMGAQSRPVIRIGADTSGEMPVFFVADNGIGIDPRYFERVFNLFERLDTLSPGTGVGLTIVRRIIEVHGGKVWAESEGLGMGTTFKFTLPGPSGNEKDGP